MIPIEFFNWVETQWWGMPAFVTLVLASLALGAVIIGGSSGTRD